MRRPMAGWVHDPRMRRWREAIGRNDGLRAVSASRGRVAFFCDRGHAVAVVTTDDPPMIHTTTEAMELADWVLLTTRCRCMDTGTIDGSRVVALLADLGPFKGRQHRIPLSRVVLVPPVDSDYS